MAETKFTKGPWVRHDTHQGIYVGGADGPAIVQLITTQKPDVSFQLKQEANAHLIAAAPALYEALVALINAPIIYTGAIEEPIATCGIDSVKPFLDQAHAALALAEGKQ